MEFYERIESPLGNEIERAKESLRRDTIADVANSRTICRIHENPVKLPSSVGWRIVDDFHNLASTKFFENARSLSASFGN
jgi:hypothetical protein